MLHTLIILGLGPTLVALATLATTRWGAPVGGAVSAFPAVVGPVLLVLALEHGRAFAARTAAGTLLGLVALAAFVLTYGWAALRWSWPASLSVAWLAAAAAATGTALLAHRSGSSTSLLVAVASLGFAYAALPSPGRAALSPIRRSASPRPVRRSRHPVLARMAATAALVSLLTGAAGLVGPDLGGMLGALPVLASVLSVFAHRDSGTPALLGLLRGMVVGMAAFVAFCEVLALALRGHDLAPAFLIATAAAILVQSLSLAALPRRAESVAATSTCG